MGYRQLAEDERYQIERYRRNGYSIRQMARWMGRSASTISRELRRNASVSGYWGRKAHRVAKRRCRDRRRFRKLSQPDIERIVHLLREGLSPEQAVDYLSRHGHIKLCHETVYRLIAADKCAGGELYKLLRIAKKSYRRRYGTYKRTGSIPNRVSIHERPAVVEQRTRIGDWEGDTIIGRRKRSAILTLVERKSLFVIIVKLNGKGASQLAQAMIQAFARYPDKVKTATLDNGREFAHHEKVTAALGVPVYFADPYSSWQRGSNENTNGLIRQYFPKGTDFNQVSPEALEAVQQRLNRRPRKTRGWRSPNELFLGIKTDLLATLPLHL